ncbi:uncharacterized protein LOC130736458 [Lotus japonicus]|uniref:uncharacterized protein LOC130736458 n=1 Tax=Lotus japonicus TaxID=34305 RepID=UPI002587368F|nr:uncharacterized protein LOC130736458 [Lotus japonicus]
MTTSSTRQKKSGDGVYATSSDRSASIEGDEYEATQPATRPLGKKNQKRKAKVGDTTSSDLDYVPNSEMIAIGKAKLGFLASFEKLKTEELEEEMEFYQRRANTVRPKRTRKVIERDREAGNERLWNDYFSENPVYTEELFRRRFRMRKHVFLRIVGALGSHDPYFLMSVDAVGRQGLSPLQKCTAAIRMLAYGSPADSVDEYVRIGESTAIECLKNFVEGVCAVFGETYLRRPNQEDITHLLQWGESRGFPGMLGSIDCMHWEWKNCPVAWKGQFTRGDHGKPTIMLEAVASQDLWICHAFFGIAGSNNDTNVLNQSPVFNEVLSGNAPMVNFSVNGTMYNMGYYLADGIYPPWATFVKTIPMPQGEKRQKFAKRQEGARKDVESDLLG